MGAVNVASIQPSNQQRFIRQPKGLYVCMYLPMCVSSLINRILRANRVKGRRQLREVQLVIILSRRLGPLWGPSLPCHSG